MKNEPRWAELILVDQHGAVLGKLPPVLAGTQWWPEVETVVHAVREQHGIDATILRLHSAERPRMPGGHVTYVAQVNAPVQCAPCNVVLPDHALRNRYAKAGGPDADLAWAMAVLAQHDERRLARAEQVKTWNLSSLWRIPLANSNAWLKAVPEFFRHEGALINALSANSHVPRLYGFEPGRLVMREIPGEDLFNATLEQRLAMIDVLVDLQATWINRSDELFALGLPDWRAPALRQSIASVFARTRHELDTADTRIIEHFIAGLDERFAQVAQCGLPDTLVHGDYHPGNVRGAHDESHQLTVLDWGDAGVGQPLLDCPAFMDRGQPPDQLTLREHWQNAWQAVCPNANPGRAWDLLKPIAAARQALIYRHFLDHIEPAEHPYHRDDPRESLQRVAAILRQERD